MQGVTHRYLHTHLHRHLHMRRHTSTSTHTSTYTDTRKHRHIHLHTQTYNSVAGEDAKSQQRLGSRPSKLCVKMEAFLFSVIGFELQYTGICRRQTMPEWKPPCFCCVNLWHAIQRRTLCLKGSPFGLPQRCQKTLHMRINLFLAIYTYIYTCISIHLYVCVCW